MTLPRQLPWLGLALFFSVMGCGDLEDKRPAKWSFLYATIIQPQCATVNCHSAIAKKGDYDFHSRDVAYCSLTPALIPGVLQKDSGDIPRMPPDAPLPAPDIELLTAWANDQGGVNDKFPADQNRGSCMASYNTDVHCAEILKTTPPQNNCN